MTNRARAWLAQWGPMLPLLIAEATIWAGFGALLPILPIYFTQHGVSLPMLGLVVAAWPIARLVGEPVFGRIADSVPRRNMMVIGLLLAAVFAVAPLFFVGPAAFILARLLAGLSASIYDPAARGYLVDANPPERQGETFGLYGAAQMGGLMLGPAIGGLAAAVTGNPTIVFWVAGICVFLSGILVWARVREIPRTYTGPEAVTAVGSSAGEAPAPHEAATTADSVPDPLDHPTGPELPRPTRLLNRLLIAAIVLNIASFFAGGTYEVVWSLYLTDLGADLALIGLTFFTFALPILLLSPVMGRFIDREGGFLALIVGMAGIGICGAAYALAPSPWFVIVLGLAEGAAFAVASPALYMLVSRASPPGRSSTAQGIFGAAGTIGTITASLAAGVMAEADLRLPFLSTGVVIGVLTLLGLAIGRRRLYDAMQPAHIRPREPGPALGQASGQRGVGEPVAEVDR
ncbi:MAG TPA: MFS transporter [Candidatus Limnocylindrales bacterium]|nr:MFS transporter [Candidatus Limnocylindrales bacterium]